MEKVTAIFDIGKTNKKLLLFDDACRIVYECTEHLPETKDDDGFPCEDIALLKRLIETKWAEVLAKKEFNISYVNFTAYGASFVHLDENNNVVTPLYSYLKSFPTELSEKLYKQYGGKWNFSAATYSPPMGMLNSGLQLLWLKYGKAEVFKKITTSLHLPQYLSFLFSKIKTSDYTSIGCHTALWDFTKNNYHSWVWEEGLDKFLAPISSNAVGIISTGDRKVSVGSGLHDSSSALIPYLKKIKEPFLLISTGTWCITLNPFNHTIVTREELSCDCLCYLSPTGKPVRASRIFLGKEHEYQTERLATHFGKNKNYYGQLKFSQQEILKLLSGSKPETRLVQACMQGTGPFPDTPNGEWNLNQFASYEDAYLQLLIDITCLLKYSVQLVDTNYTETIFVEGGFGGNELFMNLLANHFPNKKVRASFLQQATALGAALSINESMELNNWEFRDYSSSEISSYLEKYYWQFINQYEKPRQVL